MSWYTPYTDEDIEKDRSVLKPDEYSFDVMNAEFAISSTGKKMIKVLLCIFDNAGEKHFVKDWLMGEGKMRFKLKHFCDGAGILDKFEVGVEPDDCKARTGKAIIGIKQDKKDDGTFYPPKPYVIDYLKAEQVLGKTKDSNGDDIPF